MTGARIAAPLALAVALAIATLTLAPRAFEAGLLLSFRDHLVLDKHIRPPGHPANQPQPRQFI